MTALVMALYAEGPSDARFLPTIIRRTLELLLMEHSRQDVDVLDVLVVNHGIKRDNPTQVERILAAARATAGYHALVVHLDADAPVRDRAYQERFAPGLSRVLEERAGVCTTLIPLIPFQAVEAWMLADVDALRQVIGSASDNAVLAAPAIEADRTPKVTLSQCVQRALATRRRRRHFDLSSIYEPLGQVVRLEHLARLSSYAQFRDDLLEMLRGIRLVEPI